MEIVMKILTVLAWIVSIIQYFTLDEEMEYLSEWEYSGFGGRTLIIIRNTFYAFCLYKVEGFVASYFLGEAIYAWQCGGFNKFLSVVCSVVFVLFLILCLVKFCIITKERELGNIFTGIFVIAFVSSLVLGTINRVDTKTTYYNNIETVTNIYQEYEERDLFAFFGKPIIEAELEIMESLDGTAEQFGIVTEITYCYLDDAGNMLYDTAPHDKCKIIAIADNEKARLNIEISYYNEVELNHNDGSEKVLYSEENPTYYFYLPESFIISILGDAYIKPPVMEAG